MSEFHAEDVDFSTGEILTEGPVGADGIIRVPSSQQFTEGVSLLPAPDARERADVLLKRHPEHFGRIVEAKVQFDVLWKDKTSASRPWLGLCGRVSGREHFYSRLHFVILLAADIIREQMLTDRQIEALLFHEMLHMGVSDKGKPILIGHDLEEFRAVVAEYGLWMPDVRAMGETFKQVGLFDFAGGATRTARGDGRL